jgi:hypothetical protein
MEPVGRLKTKQREFRFLLETEFVQVGIVAPLRRAVSLSARLIRFFCGRRRLARP